MSHTTVDIWYWDAEPFDESKHNRGEKGQFTTSPTGHVHSKHVLKLKSDDPTKNEMHIEQEEVPKLGVNYRVQRPAAPGMSSHHAISHNTKGEVTSHHILTAPDGPHTKHNLRSNTSVSVPLDKTNTGWYAKLHDRLRALPKKTVKK